MSHSTQEPAVTKAMAFLSIYSPSDGPKQHLLGIQAGVDADRAMDFADTVLLTASELLELAISESVGDDGANVTLTAAANILTQVGQAAYAAARPGASNKPDPGEA